MIHNTLSALLVSVASRYAELSPSDLGIGISGGRLVIDNVKLRADVFNGPHVPFHVQDGRAGRLRVKVPWSALSSAPVELYLENVHLIAAPKRQHPPRRPAPPPPPLAGQKDLWHQTLLGRLLFNVSVEMYGLKVEYRDQECVGIISVASLRAFSVGRDGNVAFVSLVSDSNADYSDSTTAVAMRKVLKLNGVHWVMIPRAQQNRPADKLDDAERNLDLDSFESKSPILDGIGITIKVLCCTGTAFAEDESQKLVPGLHAEVDVELEEPDINLTARQLKWIDGILKKGFGNSGKRDSAVGGSITVNSGSPTRRRPRHSYATVSESTQQNGNAELRDGDAPNGNPISFPPQSERDAVDASVDSDTDTSRRSNFATSGEIGGAPDDDAYAEGSLLEGEYGDDEPFASSEEDEAGYYPEKRNPSRRNGRLSSFWQAIVGENSDETVDDAAIALGLESGYPISEENNASVEEDEEDRAQSLFARNAVNSAAKAGGLTFKLRVKTPDVAAWDIVEQLREELGEERQVRERLENLGTVLEEAEEHVRTSELEAESLRQRNVALMKELKDLEILTSQAGKNKDAMIRQMEAALMKAERNLQAMFQAQFEQKEAERRQRAVAAQEYQGDTGTESEEVTALSVDTETSVQQNVAKEHSSSADDSEYDTQPSQSVGVESPVEELLGEKAQVEVESSVVDKTGDELETPGTRESEQDLSNIRVGQEDKQLPSLETIEVHSDENREEGEVYFSKANSRKLEEAISSEGLTLI